MQNINLNEPDQHIVDELNKIKWPIINFEGHKIFLRERYGNIVYTINHISEKRHFTKVRDIKLLPSILRKPFKVIPQDGRKRKIYFGKRHGNKGNDHKPFLQIVTEVYNDKEYITTLYPVNKIIEKKLPKPN